VTTGRTSKLIIYKLWRG